MYFPIYLLSICHFPIHHTLQDKAIDILMKYYVTDITVTLNIHRKKYMLLSVPVTVLMIMMIIEYSNDDNDN